MAVEEELELGSDVGSRKIEAFVAEKLFLHLGKLLLGRIDLLHDESDMVGDERHVLVGQVGCRLGVFGRVSEGIESEEIRRDDGDEHQNVDCRRPQRCSSESGSSVSNFQ